MYPTLKALLRRLDFWLRNEPYRPVSDDFRLIPFEDIFDKNPEVDPLRTRVYWGVRRFWVNHWLCNPRDVYREIKFAHQRLTRGWDDRAAWSVDWWLDNMMPGVLRLLKEKKHGIPCSMFDGLPMNDEGYHDKPEYAIAEARWDAIMDKMVAAFEAHRRMDEGLYEEELGEYPLRRPEGVSKEDWEKVRDDRMKASRLLEERDEKIFQEGMKLFVEHYGSLWD
jgi:hypothetical protein